MKTGGKTTFTAQHIKNVLSNVIIDGLIAIDKGNFGKDFANYHPPKPTTEIDVRLAINTYYEPPKKILFVYYKKDDTWYQVDGSQEGGSSGYGDMYKSTYDPDLDGIVENSDHADEADLAHDSEKLGGHEPSYYALSDHSHALEALINVNINNVKNGQVLVYDSENNIWINQDQQVGGDMYKSTYDSDNDGKVDSAEIADYATNAGHADDADHATNSDKLENHPASYFATSDHSHALNDLNDVNIDNENLQGDQVLGYDATNNVWVNKDIGGGDMYKFVYDNDDDGIVEHADYANNAGHATNSDKLNNYSDTDFMLKNDYDSDNDGKVDNAENADNAQTLQGKTPSDFAPSDHLHALDDLTDVNIDNENLQNNQVLSYDASNNIWTNKNFTCGDMLKSVYDANDDGKVDEAHHADIADSLSDVSNFMMKDDYDSDRDGKVDYANQADNANNADNLENHPASYFATANHNHNLSNLLDVDDTNKGDGKVLQWSQSQGTHIYVSMSGGGSNFDYVNSSNPTRDVNPTKDWATWLNTTTGEIFVCIDKTTNYNKWRGQLGTRISIGGPLDIFGDGSCIALYRFEGNANDESGNYNGIWNGTEQYDTGVFGQAAKFDGSSYIRASNVLGTSTPTIWSFSFWFKTNNTNVGIISFASNDNYHHHYEFYVLNNGNLGLYLHDGSPHQIDLNIIVNDNKFYFVTLTDDNGNVNVFINGKNIFSQSYNSLRRNVYDLIIGKQILNNINMQGLIDQVRIFNRALNANEVQQLYNEF